jgi:hypothetical protein
MLQQTLQLLPSKLMMWGGVLQLLYTTQNKHCVTGKMCVVASNSRLSLKESWQKSN